MNRSRRQVKRSNESVFQAEVDRAVRRDGAVEMGQWKWGGERSVTRRRCDFKPAVPDVGGICLWVIVCIDSEHGELRWYVMCSATRKSPAQFVFKGATGVCSC